MKKKKYQMMKNSLIWMLCMAVAMANIPSLAVMAQQQQTAEQEETAEEKEKVYIRTEEDLLELALQCKQDGWSEEKEVYLMNDLNLLESQFTYIPTFKGLFEGNGHTISGYSYEENGYVVGFFRYIEEGGKVQNLNLRGSVKASEEQENIGGICGINRGTIQNCTFQGKVDGKSATGGIAGTNDQSGVISKCTVKGRITGFYYTGGLAGKNYGTIVDSRNYANVNDNSEWVEQDDESGMEILKNITKNDNSVKIQSGVDTGGIAGYSQGNISYCVNNGRIGYEHTGYNIGGIAGRQSGTVISCTNYGSVYGRKDIGGIVGQMEPYVEMNEAESVKVAVNKLYQSVNKLLDDMNAASNTFSADTDMLKNYADGALDSGHILADKLVDNVNENITQANEITERLGHILDMLPNIMDHVKNAGNTMDSFHGDIRELGDNIEFSGDLAENENVKDAVNSLKENTEKINEHLEKIEPLIDELQDLLIDSNGNLKDWNNDLNQDERERVKEIIQELEQELDAAGDIMPDLSDDIAKLTKEVSGYVSEAADKLGSTLKQTANHAEKLTDSLESALDGVRAIIDYLNAQADIQFEGIDLETEYGIETLHYHLLGISNCMDLLSDDGKIYSDVIYQDLKAVNDQMNKVFNLFADRVEEYTGSDQHIIYADVSDEDLETETQGRVDYCKNFGVIEGDIDVGGIAGSMSIDEEDPENNAAGKAGYSFGDRYLTKCIITYGENQGEVIAKKDGVGGIVGFMNMGVVADCEAYGMVKSTDGDYIGGICGQSLSLIRRCYALCSLSGNRNIGGITGYGATITDCYSMADIIDADSRFGAIAGQIALDEEQEDAMQHVTGNYYVGDKVGGIDNISYTNAAQLISYEELIALPQIPKTFQKLKVTFKADGSSIGTQELKMGQSMDELIFPEIPYKEGYYGEWPDMHGKVMTGNVILEAVYHDEIPIVKEETQALAIAEGSFTDKTRLVVTNREGQLPAQIVEDKNYISYDIELQNSSIGKNSDVQIRIKNPYEKLEIWHLQDDKWVKTEGKTVGQYVQVTMTGTQGSFCLVEDTVDIEQVIKLCLCILGIVVVLAGSIKVIRKMRKKGKRRQS